MLGVCGTVDLEHYEQRLKQVLGLDQYPLALDLLTEAAVNDELTVEMLRLFQAEYQGQIATISEVLEDILQILEHDGYLLRYDSGYRFPFRLLQEWIKARHGQLYVPIAQRQQL